MSAQIRALVFDLDGTLLDTLEDLWAGVNFALREGGFPERSLMEIRARIGNGARMLVKRSLPEGVDEATVDRVQAVYRGYYAEHLIDRTRPYPGILPLLEELQARGVGMAVNSNKHKEATDRLAEAFLRPYISVVVGEGGGLAKKPAPDGALLALRQLGVSSEEAAYVGDSEVDVATARNAGMAFIGCAWGLRGEEALRQAPGARIVLQEPLELLRLPGLLDLR